MADVQIDCEEAEERSTVSIIWIEQVRGSIHLNLSPTCEDEKGGQKFGGKVIIAEPGKYIS